jgi:predicted membrane protein
MATLGTLFVYFIEGFLMLGAGLGALGIRLNLRLMGLLAFLHSVITYGIRHLYAIFKIPLGTHTFLILGICVVFIVLIGKQKFWDSIIAVIFSLSLILVGESFFLFPILNFFKIDFPNLLTTPGGALLAGSLYIPVFIVFFFCYILKFTVINLSNFKNVTRL